MIKKPTYKEPEQRIGALEKAVVKGKRMKDPLLQGNEAFQSLFDNHTAVMLVIDPDTGSIVTANHAAATFYGLSRETLAQMNIQEINVQSPDKIKAAMKAAKDQKRPHFEIQHRLADGSVRDVAVFSNRISMAGYGYLHSIIHDITERKHAEREKTIISEIGRVISTSLDIDVVYERFASEVGKLIPFDRLGICLYDVHAGTAKIAYVVGLDISARKKGDRFPLTGSMSELLIRKRTGLLITPTAAEDLAKQFPSLLTSYRKGMNSLITVPLISWGVVIGELNFRSTETKAYTEQHLRLAERIGDQIAGTIANAQLFDKLKKAEIDLRESEARFRTIFNQAAVGIAEVDVATGRYLNVNQRHCEILGMTKDEVLSTTFQTVTYPEDSQMHEEPLALMVSGKLDSITLEKRFIRKDGKVIWVNVTASPLWKPGEKPERDIVVIEDITKRKRAEENLNNILDQLESRVQERTIELEEINTALQVLLKKGGTDQRKWEESVQSNINELVMPFLRKLKKHLPDKESISYLNILETNLSNIASQFVNNLSVAYKNLTPKEIQIAELIKQGKSSKEMAEIFGLSVGTVITHRNNIRKKMNLTSKNTNLRSHLLFLS